MLKADQAAIEDAQIQFDSATPRALFDGVTGLSLIDVGDLVRPTAANGVVLTQVQPIDALFTLPAADFSQVRATLARDTAAATACDQAGTRRLDEGRFLLVDDQAAVDSGPNRFRPAPWASPSLDERREGGLHRSRSLARG